MDWKVVILWEDGAQIERTFATRKEARASLRMLKAVPGIVQGAEWIRMFKRFVTKGNPVTRWERRR